MARKMAVPGTPVRRTASVTFTRSATCKGYRLPGTTAVEPVANHPQRVLDQRHVRQGVRLVGPISRFAEDPENLGDLPLGEPDFDVVHGGTIRQPKGVRTWSGRLRVEVVQALSNPEHPAMIATAEAVRRYPRRRD